MEAKGKFTIHSLRDTYASLLLQTGKVSLAEVQKLFGHASPVMTNKYAHFKTDETSAKMVGVLEGVYERGIMRG